MTFDHISIDNGPDNAEMQKAISDMQKDQILQRYQYFIESSEY